MSGKKSNKPGGINFIKTAALAGAGSGVQIQLASTAQTGARKRYADYSELTGHRDNRYGAMIWQKRYSNESSGYATKLKARRTTINRRPIARRLPDFDEMLAKTKPELLMW